MDCTSQGIYSAQFNTDTGALSPPTLAAVGDNPSYLTVTANGRYVYAVNEIDDWGGVGAGLGAVSAFAVEHGTLRALNQVSSLGSEPAHISVTRSGRTVLVANYTGGSVATFGVEADGRLKEGKVVQLGGMGPRPEPPSPQAHYVAEGPNGLIYVTDHGTDQVFIYKLDAATSTLTPNVPPSVAFEPGSGPRHLAFHPRQDIVYVNAELSAQVVVFQLDRISGGLTQLQSISAVPPGTAAGVNPNTAEIQVSPDGKFLYVSVRRANAIAIYAVADDGTLTAVDFPSSGGETPRDFKLDPAGNFLLVGHQDTNDVSIHGVDNLTGELILLAMAMLTVAPTKSVLSDDLNARGVEDLNMIGQTGAASVYHSGDKRTSPSRARPPHAGARSPQLREFLALGDGSCRGCCRRSRLS